MTEISRKTRRMAGVLSARLPEIGLELVADTRSPQGIRWPKLKPLLTAPLVAMAAGLKSFADTEKLTVEMSRAMRKKLGIRRRIPDTTMRNTMVKVSPNELRKAMRRQTKAAHKRKALMPDGFPFGVVAIDGKYTPIDSWDGRYSQYQSGGEDGVEYGLVRTINCSLVSSRAKVCIDSSPIPSRTNEMGQFKTVINALVGTYKRTKLFAMVSADAGSCSEENGRHVQSKGLHYIFGLKGSQPTLQTEARAHLARLTAEQAVASTVDIRGRYEVTRRLYLTTEMAGFLDWTHLQTTLRVESEMVDIETGEVVKQDEDDVNRYFISSLEGDRLTPSEWLKLVRMHWGVENNCHNTWDTAFEEDDRRWITADPKGAMNVMLIRRLAYNMLALFRSVTQRSEENRMTQWKDILRWVYNTLIAVQETDLASLRERTAVITEI
jgi:predicted transposase YbfD/YdcC